jgi:endonuclease/exonuclease/phosphatase family metal-dependent hydrolase
MPAFPKPKFSYNFDLQNEIASLKAHKQHRQIPEIDDDHVLIATWNIANLGLQKRWNEHYQMMAEMIQWFDVIAVQEVNDNLSGLRALESFLPAEYDLLFSDKAGNNERTAFIYNGQKLKLLEKVGELAVPPKDHKDIHLESIDQPFKGFDRNPYIAAFSYRNFDFILINVHVFFGSDRKKEDLDRRALEAYAIARYSDLRRRSKNAFSRNIITLGDFNIPKAEPGDPIYEALMARGLKVPEHSSKIYSNISSDKQYDQIAFFPGIKSRIHTHGVFDFDSVIFPDLWQQSAKDFRAYVKYYISDHRPMWLQLHVDPPS